MDPRIDEGIRLMRAGQHAQAQAAYEDALGRDPANPLVINLLCVALFRQGRVAEAAERLSALLRHHPGHLDSRFNLGIAFQTSERHGEAAAQFRAVLELQPDHAGALSRLGSCLQLLGDLEGSITALRRSAAVAPLSETLLSLGGALHSCGVLPEAVAMYRGGLATGQGDANAHGLLGRALLGLGRITEAGETFATALARDAADTQARQGRARCALYRDIIDPPATAPDGLVARGSLSGPSGYAHMSRHFVRHLCDQGVALRTVGLYGREPWQPPGSPDTPGAMLHLDGPVRARGVLNFLIPALVEPLPGLRTVTFSMFEGPRVPRYWARITSGHDLTIVPTVSSRDAWVAAGQPEDRIRVCPLGVDPALDAAMVEPLPVAVPGGRPLGSFRTRILNVSDFIPRKNLDGLLRTWLTATTAADDAVLVVKVGKGDPRQLEEIRSIVRRTEEAVGRRLDQAAPLAILNVRLNDDQMTALFATATHYWSMSHGEGWDLPMTQAGAMGLRLIAPDHSAYRDYLDPTVAWMIPSRTVPAFRPYSREPWGPFHGLEWWQPDEAYAAGLIRALVRGEEEPRDGARERLRRLFTWEQATRTLTGLLREVGAL